MSPGYELTWGNVRAHSFWCYHTCEVIIKKTVMNPVLKVHSSVQRDIFFSTWGMQMTVNSGKRSWIQTVSYTRSANELGVSGRILTREWNTVLGVSNKN